MKSWIGARAGGRINPLPAQSGLARLDPLAVFDPAVAGSTRWRFDPAPWSGLIRSRLDPVLTRLMTRLTRARVNPAGGADQPACGLIH
jgi:hypothetical protein